MYDGMYNDEFGPYFGFLELPEEVKNSWKKLATHQRTKNFQKKLPKYKEKMRKANQRLAWLEKRKRRKRDRDLSLEFKIDYFLTKRRAQKYADLVNLGKHHLKPGSDNPFEQYDFRENE